MFRLVQKNCTVQKIKSYDELLSEMHIFTLSLSLSFHNLIGLIPHMAE